jgi:pilus assembly protein CpaC
MRITMTRILLTGLFLALLGGPAARAEDMPDDVVEMYIGEIKILQVGDIRRIAVGNASVLSTSLLSNGQLLLIAEGEGTSNVHIWLRSSAEKDLTVRVDKSYGTLAKAANEVRLLLSDIEGLKVRIVGERIVLSGRVDASHENAISTVLGVFGNIMDLTQKSNPEEYDVIELPMNKMVFMNIKITEFNRNYLETLGISWQNEITGPAAGFAFDAATNNFFRSSSTFDDALPLKVTSPIGYFGIATEIASRINFAVNSGNALILAEPRLATRSGGQATFLAGGEVPLITSTFQGVNIEYKEFGISLQIKPEVDRKNNIRAHVATEVTAVDPSVSVSSPDVGNVPGFLSRKTSTDISIRSGETLVISGLIDQQLSRDVSGLKFLSEIPILGELFKSKTFRDRKSELVIFVTPTVFDADSDMNQAELKRRREGIDATIKAIGANRLEIID